MTPEQFYPPKRILMGPGPSDVPNQVLQAMSRPTIGHLDPKFIELMDQIQSMLRTCFQTKNSMTFPVSAPGSAGMEMCFVNLVEPGDKVIVCQNGVFGLRMRQIVERIGGEAVIVADDWGKPVSLEQLEQTLQAHKDAKIIAFVHGETSTGALSDAQAIGKMAQDYGCMTIVDAVTTLGGSPLKVDEWGLSAVYSGSQKCLSSTPGLSPVSFNEQALERVKNRKSGVISWFLDLNLIMSYWNDHSKKRAYHHTAPVNPLYGLHESLLMLAQEGLEHSWARHQKLHLSLKQGLESLGLEFLVDEQSRLPQLNSVMIPAGVDDAKVRSGLLETYGLEIGAGLGPLAGKIWRIGLMGASATQANVALCIAALKAML